jgi:hypothetical protein
LRFRCRAIDLVAEHDLRKDRAAMKLEAAAVTLVDRNAEDVGGEQIARKLNALITEPERFRQRMGQRRLADARQVLDQQVAFCQHAGDGQPELVLFADNDGFQRRDDRFDQVTSRGVCFRCRVQLRACHAAMVAQNDARLQPVRRFV